MPVIPAPTTSTSTSGAAASMWVPGPRGFLYRPFSLRTRPRYPEADGARHAGVLRDGAPRPGAQAAVLRPRLLRPRGRAALVSHVADGVPARGDPRSARLRRVPVPRPVDHRFAHRRHGRRG